MKNLITFLVLLTVVQIGQSQCPQNTVPGSTFSEFDWTANTFEMYIKDYPEANGANPPYTIPSPFSIANNSAQFNTDHFAEEIPVDNAPTAGWEVLFYNFGTAEIYVDQPSFALYNRYNGLVRFFMLISDNGGFPYQQAFVSAYMSKLGDEFSNSALLESQNAIHHSLEDFEKKLSINTVNAYNNNSDTWIVSEWLTHYDPCTCLSTMKLTFFPTLQSIQSLSLNIDGSTSTVPIYESTMTANSGDIRTAVGAVGTNVEQLSGAYKKGNEIYKSFDKFESVIETSVGESNLTETSPAILVGIARIATGVSTGNYLAVAAGLIAGVNTLVKSSSTKTIASYSSKHSFNAGGAIESLAPHQATEVYVPGSNHAGYPTPKKPIYDNILGIASVIETPLFDYMKEEIVYVDDCPEGGLGQTTESYVYYKLYEDIKYSINTSAGIKNIPLDSKAALYFDVEVIGSCNGQEEESIIANYMQNNGLIKVSTSKWRTPFMNLSCLKEYPVTFQVGLTDDCQYNHCEEIRAIPYLAFAMVLESQDDEEIAYLKSYKVKRTNPSYNWANKPENQFLDVKEDLVIDYDDITSTTQSWGNTTVENPPSKEIVITNSSGGTSIVFLDTDNDPTTPIKYTTDEFTIDCGDVLPVAASYLSQFCNNENKYDPIVALLQSNTSDLLPEVRKPLKVKPNPVEDILSIEYETINVLNYRIFNSVGQLVLEGEVLYSSIFVGELNSGMYILQLFDNQKLIADEKLIKL